MATTAITAETLEDGAGDTGLDNEVLTLEESQGVDEYMTDEESAQYFGEPISDITSEEAAQYFGNAEPGTITEEESAQYFGNTSLTTSAGAGNIDDSGAVTFSGTQAAANTATSNAAVGKITPQGNVLDRFATYNYAASVYLMSPNQLKQYIKSKKKNVNGYNLLFQTGGAPNNVGGPQNGKPSSEAGRSPFFPNDFYIDSITLENQCFGKATGAAHSVAELKFTVIEPSNITLIDCLYNAVQDMAPTGADGAVNYAAAVYLMVIRFYGQDINGKIQRVGSADGSGLSDPNSLIEKFIPFKIKDINFSVGSRAVSYEFQCAPIGQMIGGGTRRGTIPADVELSASSVNAMLTGTAGYSSTSSTADAPGATTTAAQDNGGITHDDQGVPLLTPAPSKADAAPTNKKTIRQGLIQAMNEFQTQLVKDGTYEKADVYELVFANGAESIRDGKIAKPDKTVNKSATPVGAAASQDPSAASPDKGGVDPTARNWSITAGMQLFQAIEMIIRNSSYVTDQALFIIDEETGKQIPNPKANKKGVKWFNILVETTQLEYDNKRNDFAYNIKYVIVPYTLVDFNSQYFPLPTFQGLHKQYSWWFTGANTQVIDYQATFNKLYSLTVSGSTPGNNFAAKEKQKYLSSMRDIPFVNYQARSTESAQGAEGKANELAASAAESLYNASDNANAKIRILGDPAWIQQGSVTGAVDTKNLNYAGFLPDGTINFDVNDIMFEIAWQRPEDYNLATGLADPYSKTMKTFGDRNPRQSVIYRARAVTSEFRQGKFEQILDGTLYRYPVPDGSNKATSASKATDSETARITTNGADTGTRTGSAVMTESAELNMGDIGPLMEPEGAELDPLSEPEDEVFELNLNESDPSDDVDLAANSDPESNGEPLLLSDANLDEEDFVAPGRISQEDLDGINKDGPQLIDRDW